MVTNMMIMICCGFTIWSGQCQETDSVYELYVKTLEKYNRVSDVLTLSSSPDAVRTRKEHYLVFVNAKKLVDRINSDDSVLFTAELNMFSVMTEAEKDLYKGVSGNMSEMILAEESLLSSSVPVNLLSAPSSVDHSQNGQVPVKNQGGCRACWAFSSISAVEFAYYKVTGDLIAFSEQELVDCVYDGQDDGCGGGWMTKALKYIQNNQRLASEQDAPYLEKDNPGCDSGNLANSLSKARYEGKAKAQGDQELLAAAATDVVSVAILITNSFYYYQSGVFEDHTVVAGTPNHAGDVVGYGNSNGHPFWKVRNSWDTTWGRGGYIYMSRSINNIIGLSLYGYIPQFTCTGSCNPPDTGNDIIQDTVYDTFICKNEHPDDFCNAYIFFCSTPKNSVWYNIMKKYCKKTCDICEDDDDDQQDNADGCPSGLTKCSDGICRHVHMCP